MLNRTNPIPLLVTHALCWLCLAALTSPAAAAFVYWQHDPATPGDWFDAANWNRGVPGLHDNPYINNGGTALIANPGTRCGRLILGSATGQSGTLELSNETSSLASGSQYIGYDGTGTVIQNGGNNTIDGGMLGDGLYLGYRPGSTGTYEFHAGELSVSKHEYIGHEGTGTFIQNGGRNTISEYLHVGSYSSSNGTYELHDGELSADQEFISGTFIQYGGSNTIRGDLHLMSESAGTYELHGGELSANQEDIGFLSTTSTFIQTGGNNTTTYLSIWDPGSYVLSGGTLQVTEGVSVRGTLDFVSGDGSVTMAGLVDFAEATLNGADSATFTLGPNSLFIVPADFDPETEFAEFTSNGSRVHHVGSTLYIGATETVTVRGKIPDHVDIHGSLHATAGQGICLSDGLRVWGNGSVHLGTGSLTVKNSISGISDAGELSANQEYIGYDGIGAFFQYGGTNTIRKGLYLGYSTSGSSGSYELHAGELSAEYEYVGYGGTGTFIQNGGINTISGSLYVGQVLLGSTGTYEFHDGALSAGMEYIGFGKGTGTFVQYGGNNSISECLYVGYKSGSTSTGTYELHEGNNSIGECLYVGYESGSTGMYELHDGGLSADREYVGYEGTGTFIQHGGNHAVSGGSYGKGLYIGYESDSTGTYELHDGELSTLCEYVGYEGTGTFIQYGGNHAVRDNSVFGRGFFIAYGIGSRGTYELQDGELSAIREYVGRRGTGKFIQNGGSNTASILYLGHEGKSSGTYELHGGSMRGGSECVGHNYSGMFIQDGGSNTIEYSLYLGYRSCASGTYKLHDGELSAEDERVGYSGTGTFVQNGGNNTIWEGLYVGKSAQYSPPSIIILPGEGTITGQGSNPVDEEYCEGSSSGSTGTYELNGGELAAGNEYVGNAGTGAFVQNGGSNTISGGLYLGKSEQSSSPTIIISPGTIMYVTCSSGEEACSGSSSGADGTYELNDGELAAGWEFVGYDGTGAFVQNGGSNAVLDGLCVGSSIGSGTYELNGGELSANYECVLDTFVQNGGSNAISRYLYMGYSPGSGGSYELHDGTLSTTWEYVGYEGTGTFVQNGGGHVAGHSLYVGCKAGSNGTYELHSGEMSAWREYVGASGTGTLVQDGGNNAVGDILHVGYNVGSSGTYELHDGHLSANRQYVGYGGSGTFIQDGGTNTISNVLHIGRFSCSDGTYELHGGTLSAGTINVGRTGTLGIYNAEAMTTIHAKLHFGAGGTFTAVPGSAIHMTGSAFENESTDADAMAGLANLTLIFEGGTEDVDPFEVAGEDLGAVREGFDGNFVLDALQLGEVSGVGQVQLVDLFDNQPEWEGSEALYVKHLQLEDGALLDLNGLNLYYRSFIDLGGTIELGGGNLVHVSMPGDANRDEIVDDQDASILASNWQQSGMSWENGDFNNDGIVDDADASILAAHWQQIWEGEGEGAAAVPEPAAIVLCIPLCLAGIFLSRRKRRRPA